ncbi:TPA: hypothetical protein N0F65_009685 [Lagenidium giganteum]|uniref:ubiquitinyl hydrolase 1 n=1 Tax=Lagenidium giganteum TaxID=4803 RepID=A0AAV2YWP7_9STRA|nr:TPA: hypothetical protein N0F65_009685 [Lagenidium giganteum]
MRPTQSTDTSRRTMAPRGKRKRDKLTPILTARDAAPRDDAVAVSDPYRVHLCGCKFTDHLHRKRNQKTPTILKNCAENPNCLYGLGEHSKVKCMALAWICQGIWNSKALVRRILGEDPRDLVRQPRPQGNGILPCGLRNLGATCYLNSMLQCLFMNLTFRQALFEWEPKENVAPAMTEQMRALQRLFGGMQMGNKAHYDPQQFSSTLSLNEVLQQDAQEFSKLLLTHLRTTFAHSRVTEHWDLIDQLFQGQMNYVTKCLKCKNRSQRPSSYYEISLHVKGNKSVDQCVQQYLAGEVLDGDNKYFCDNCQSKERAERCIELDAKSLPPTLTLQLMRFVYDPAAGAKKKLMDVIEISETLNMTDLLRRSGVASAFHDGDDAVYRLCAYLNHRGKSAHIGHYTASVAHPKPDDRLSSDWFEFDDSVVNNMSSLEIEGSEERAGKPRKSRDAYMLLYVREDVLAKWNSEPQDKTQPSAGLAADLALENTEFEAEVAKYQAQAGELEKRIQERLDAYARFFEKDTPFPKPSATEFYWVDADWLRAWVTGEEPKAKETTTTKESNSDNDDKSNSDAVIEVPNSPTAVARAMDAIPFCQPMPLSQYCCEHSSKSSHRLDPAASHCFAPSSVTKLKRISKGLFQYLKETCGLLSTPEHPTPVVFEASTFRCGSCESASLSRMLDDERALRDIEYELGLLKAPVADPQSAFLMSRAWISSYKTHLHQEQRILCQAAKKLKKSPVKAAAMTMKSFTPPTNDDTDSMVWQVPINEDITCPHGNLALTKKSYRSVSAETWTHFVSKFSAHREFPEQSTEPCAQCQIDREATERVIEVERATRDEVLNRAPLNRLYRRKPAASASLQVSLTLCDIFGSSNVETKRAYLVPQIWMDAWRRYIQNVDCHPPEMLSCERLLCRHDRLLLPRAFVAALEGKRIEYESVDVELVNDEEMQHLCELYGAPECWYFYGHRTATSPLQWGRCDLASVLGRAHGASNNVVSIDDTPVLCSECAETSEKEHQVALENFQNRVVHVQLLSEDQAVPTTEALSVEATPDRRRSRRLRSGATACWQILASSDDSVLVLKHKIYEEIDAVPIRQRLYFRGQVLEDGRSLRDCGIKAGDALYMRLSEDTADDDLVIAEEISQREVGFEDSVLLSSLGGGRAAAAAPTSNGTTTKSKHVWVCAACTYVNEDQEATCEICSTEKAIEID